LPTTQVEAQTIDRRSVGLGNRAQRWSRHSVTAFHRPAEGDDTFALKYQDFLLALADNVLTLKTATNTYRLKAAAAATTGQPAPVRAVFDRIERFRGQ
jgi:hypothetical protein